MIRRQDIIRVKTKGDAVTQTHAVKVTISGRADVQAFAALIEQGGKPNLAAAIRLRKSLTLTMSPEQANEIFESKK